MEIKKGKLYHDYTKVSEFTEDACMLVFEDYPIFDENHRQVLNNKIVDHYLFDELAVVPYSKWEFLLNRRMREIMPYYNMLYESQKGQFEKIFDNIDVREILDRSTATDTMTATQRSHNTLGTRSQDSVTDKVLDTTSNQNESLSSTSDGTSWKSDVPFNKVENDAHPTETSGNKDTATAGNIYSGTQKETDKTTDALTSERTENTQGTSSSNLDTDTKEDYVKTIEGKNSGFTKTYILEEYRKSLLNVDMMVIKELGTLFQFMLN